MNKLTSRVLMTAVGALAISVSGVASAAIVVGPTLNGVATFTDSNTGRNWARLDTYFNKSHNSMAADISGKGFTVAVFADVDALLDTLPLNSGQWSSYAAIMGKAPNRNLIWGSFAPVSANNRIDWAFSFLGDPSWTSFNATFDADAIPNGGSAIADMNIWAFANGAVPEPSTWAMLILGFGAVGGVMRRRSALAKASRMRLT